MRIQHILVFFLAGVLMVSSAFARVDVGFSITTTVPASRVVAAPPPGYMTCYSVPSGVYNGIWVNRHRVCQYDDDRYAGSWVAGYWTCVHYRHSGACTRWAWVDSHWVEPGYDEFGIQVFEPHHHYHHDYHHGYRSERDGVEIQTGVPAGGVAFDIHEGFRGR
jgi:hypothetical protein